MFEALGLEGWTPLQAAVVLGLVVGVLFGALAQYSRFCLRRALAGNSDERRPALAVWLAALLAALVGTQVLVAGGIIDFGEHRYLATDVPIAAITLGGLLFGIGMVLTRGCISRLTVLSAGGNLRALTAVIVFAIVAHATLKGILAPIRVNLSAMTVDASWSGGSLASLPGGLIAALAVITALTILAIRGSGVRTPHLVAAVAIGLLVPLAWFGTGALLYDDFDPLPLESLTFTLPHSQAAFWVMASTAVEPGFGVGLIGGVLLGSLFLHLVRREIRWQSFETPAQTGRYLAGASLMGAGGVLAGGCTVGAGLSGVSTLGVSSIIAIGSIAVGARLAVWFQGREGRSLSALGSAARTPADASSATVASAA